MRTYLRFFLSVVILCGIVAAGTLGAVDVPKYTFYAVGADPSVDQFFAVILKGFEAAEEVFPVDVVYLGMMLEEVNPAGMVNLLETAFAADPDGVTSGFWFADAQDEVVRRMLNAGIPVIAYNQEDLRDEPVPYLGYVGQDETKTGQKLARATLERIDIERALIGIHAPGTASVETRASGIVQVLEEEGIPYDKLDITLTPSTAKLKTVFGPLCFPPFSSWKVATPLKSIPLTDLVPVPDTTSGLPLTASTLLWSGCSWLITTTSALSFISP